VLPHRDVNGKIVPKYSTILDSGTKMWYYRSMKNILTVHGYRAVIEYDPNRNVLQGKFLETATPLTFEATDVNMLRAAAEEKLTAYLAECEANGVAPRETFSGKFNLRVSPELHAYLAAQAAATGKSLNQLIADILEEHAKKV